MDEARKINNYTIEHSFNVGNREVVMGVDETKEEPYVVAYAEFFTPACYHLMSKLTYYKTYLDAMSGYCERCTAQVQAMQEEHSRFNFDSTTLTAQDCIPCPCAYQLVLAEAGNGASGGRGSAVFGTCLATGEKARWERYEVLGEIKPEKMPFWAKDALKSIQEKTAAEKSARKRHGEAR